MENFENTTEKAITDVDNEIQQTISKLQELITDLGRSTAQPVVTLFTDGTLHAELAAYVEYIRDLPEQNFGGGIAEVEPDREDQQLDCEIRELELFIQGTKEAVIELVGEDGPEGIRDVNEIHRRTKEAQEEYKKVVEERQEVMDSIGQRKKEGKQRRQDLEMIRDGLKANLEETSSTNKKLTQESTKLKRELDLLKSRLARMKAAVVPCRRNSFSASESEQQ